MWFGPIVDIPSGFVLCDGNNGTPDLRNSFIVGAGDTYAVDAAGGSVNHTHDFTTDGHTHDIAVGASILAGLDFDDATDSAVDTGVTDPVSNLPPYHALAYIMKT